MFFYENICPIFCIEIKSVLLYTNIGDVFVYKYLGVACLKSSGRSLGENVGAFLGLKCRGVACMKISTPFFWIEISIVFRNDLDPTCWKKNLFSQKDGFSIENSIVLTTFS